MSHIALYRAWRPQRFRDIVGQNHITRTLQNALKDNRFSHAYLFSGPRGTGKTSAAKILAKAVNCEALYADGEPCDECAACRRITENAVMDVMEIDAASNRGVEEIRDIRDNVKYAPTEVRYKVYIIDEVHMLTTEAFNALLKTLEEPPQHVIFVLATTEPNRIPPTIISRCQRFDFRRVSLQDQVKRIEYICKEENISADAEALQYIARLSGGGMRDALSLLDQIISFSGERITYEQVIEVTGGLASEQFASLAAALADKDVGKVLELIEAWLLEGKHIEHSMESLIQYFRDLLLLQMLPDAEALTERILDAEGIKPIAEQFTKDELFQIIDILNRYNSEMKYASHPQTVFEIALLKICSMNSSAASNHSTASPSASGSNASDSPSALAPSNATVSSNDSPPSSISATTSGQADGTDLARLLSKVDALERQVKALMMRSPSDGFVEQASHASRQEAPSRTASPTANRSEASKVSKPPFIKKTLAGTQSSAFVQEFVSDHDEAAFNELRSNWNNILQAVKERKITVHAWLVDGEPVAGLANKVLVGFKNTIHRETTEKPANKQLIEEVMQEIMGRSVQLNTIMMKDWDTLKADKAKKEEPEILKLEPEQPEPNTSRPEWVEEAIRLFGDDLVEIKDESH